MAWPSSTALQRYGGCLQFPRSGYCAAAGLIDLTAVGDVVDVRPIGSRDHAFLFQRPGAQSVLGEGVRAATPPGFARGDAQCKKLRPCFGLLQAADLNFAMAIESLVHDGMGSAVNRVNVPELTNKYGLGKALAINGYLHDLGARRPYLAARRLLSHQTFPRPLPYRPACDRPEIDDHQPDPSFHRSQRIDRIVRKDWRSGGIPAPCLWLHGSTMCSLDG